MILGIIADTHDNLPKIKKAVELFNKKYTKLVLHAGDWVAPFSVFNFNKLNCKYLGIYGNNDGEKDGLKEKSLGKIKEGPLELEQFGKKILITHDLTKTNLTKNYDIVIFGHTHKPEIYTKNSSLFINPGECCGWLTGQSNVVILDLISMSAKIHRI